MSDSPLTPAEKARVESLLPVLEKVARRSRRLLPYGDAYAAGVLGLAKAVRSTSTPPGDLEKWAAICVQNAIRDAADSERRRLVRTVPLDCDPPDHRQSDVDPRHEAIAELPDYLARTVNTWIESGGSIARTAAALGISRAMVADNLEIAKEKLRKMLQNRGSNPLIDRG